MSRITVIGGTGYAGSSIVAEAASRGHAVTALSRSLPTAPVAGVNYVQGDATDVAALTSAIDSADVVIAALSPRGELVGRLRTVYRDVIRRAAEADARLVVVGGFSSLRPAAGAPRFSDDVSGIPEQFREEAVEVAQVITDDLPQAPAGLDWLFVSPAAVYGAHSPGERLGVYRVGDDVALQGDGGPSSISGADFGLAVVDLVEKGEHHRTQVNVAY